MKKTMIVMGCVLPAAAMAMADSTPPVYGRPTLYGEYEISGADRRRAAVMYGVVPANVGEKMPVKHKKPITKKAVKQKKAQNRAATKKKAVAVKSPVLVQDDVIVVPPRVVVADDVRQPAPEKKIPVPSEEARAIAAAAVTEDAPSIESFCTQRRPRHRGKLPDGIVLMPGRPDLMSCTDKE